MGTGAQLGPSLNLGHPNKIVLVAPTGLWHQGQRGFENFK